MPAFLRPWLAVLENHMETMLGLVIEMQVANLPSPSLWWMPVKSVAGNRSPTSRRFMGRMHLVLFMSHLTSFSQGYNITFVYSPRRSLEGFWKLKIFFFLINGRRSLGEFESWKCIFLLTWRVLYFILTSLFPQ